MLCKENLVMLLRVQLRLILLRIGEIRKHARRSVLLFTVGELSLVQNLTVLEF